MFFLLFLLLHLNLIESLVKEVELYSDHKVQHKQGSEDHTSHTEDISFDTKATSRHTDLVHHSRPALECNHLERCDQGNYDIVEVVQTLLRIAYVDTLVSLWTSIRRILRQLAEVLTPISVCLEFDVFEACSFAERFHQRTPASEVSLEKLDTDRAEDD